MTDAADMKQPGAEVVERADRCGKAPPGWLCSRARAHSGPCAAWPDEGPSDSLLAAVYQRGADPRTRRRALYDYGFAAGVRAADARAALSAIPQPAEVVGPAWRDKPNAFGWWLCRLGSGAEHWFNCRESFDVHVGSHDRWFGPVRIPEESK